MHSDDDLNLLDEDSLDQPEVVVPPDPEEMLALLVSADTAQRMTAARAFCEIQEPKAIPLLINLLQEDCPLVRVSAAYALGRNSSSETVEPLINLYHRDWNGYVRKGVIWALGNCGDRCSLTTLIYALKTDISAVRLWAASGLAQLAKLHYEDILKAIPPLIEGLRKDPVSAVRSNCAWSLGQLCREMPSNVVYATAIDALLESLVEDEDLGVKEDSRSALLKVGDPRGLQMIEDLELEGLI